MRHINLRVPDDLHKQLVEEAEEDRRSLNAELLVLLEEALEAREEAQAS